MNGRKRKKQKKRAIFLNIARRDGSCQCTNTPASYETLKPSKEERHRNSEGYETIKGWFHSYQGTGFISFEREVGNIQFKFKVVKITCLFNQVASGALTFGGHTFLWKLNCYYVNYCFVEFRDLKTSFVAKYPERVTLAVITFCVPNREPFNATMAEGSLKKWNQKFLSFVHEIINNTILER